MAAKDVCMRESSESMLLPRIDGDDGEKKTEAAIFS